MFLISNFIFRKMFMDINWRIFFIVKDKNIKILINYGFLYEIGYINVMG